MQADLPRRLLGEAGNADERDAMVLVVVGQEADLVVGEGGLGVEH